jgi:C-methyltransferase
VSGVLQELPANALMMQMLTGKWVSASISVVAELGIADLLANGDKTADELADAVSAHGPSLYRVMRALASVGVFAEAEGRRFTLTPLAECLRGNVPNSVRGFARFMAIPAASRSWDHLMHSVKTGETGLRKAFAVNNAFDYLRTHPEEAAIFDGAMTDNSRRSVPRSRRLTTSEDSSNWWMLRVGTVCCWRQFCNAFPVLKVCSWICQRLSRARTIR